MSTRYSTYFPAPLGERTIESKKPVRSEPFHRAEQARRSILTRADSVAGSTLGRRESAIRRPLNDHQSAQPTVDFESASCSKSRVTARDFMRTCAATLRPEDSIERAARLMAETLSGSVPVVDSSGTLIGIITDRDITVKLVALGASIPHAQVSDCMTGEAFACSTESSLEGCVSAMSWHQLRRIPIVDDQHKVVGTISQSDLACYLCEHPEKVERRAIANILAALAY